MGSIEDSRQKEVFGTFSIAVDLPVEEYDPWALPYGKAPELCYAKVNPRKFRLHDFRGDVLEGDYSVTKSRDFLRKNGFTVVKHHSALLAPPYGRFEDFQDATLVSDVYYREIEELMKDVTGCSHVFPTDSVMRMSGATVGGVSDASWKKTDTTQAQATERKTAHIHKPSPTPPTRIAHWDSNLLGARQTIRNWSDEISETAVRLGIIRREEEVCAPEPAMEDESNAIVEKKYDGPRYASFSVWRPLRKVTRDPIAMAPYRTVERDADFHFVSHRIKQPGSKGDWLRELGMLKIKESAAEKDGLGTETGLEWYYVSHQDVDEVVIMKSFDSASLSGRFAATGEAAGVPHASPDIGDAAYGDSRESIEVRLIAFWDT